VTVSLVLYKISYQKNKTRGLLYLSGDTAVFKKAVFLMKGIKGETNSTVANYFGQAVVFLSILVRVKAEAELFIKCMFPDNDENNFKT
jgi:hypothetical protein